MNRERKYKLYRKVALFVAVNLLVDVFYPTVSYALTGGPSQPEVQSFEPVGTTEMVDLFTGDFTYNIPLFELPGPNGGYPFNLSYHSGITMDQEASWVGLGWNLNPGVINRQMRGLPDDFDGDDIEKTQDMKPNKTFGVTGTADIEIFGGDLSLGQQGTSGNLGIGLGIYYNNYKGIGYSLSPSVSFHRTTGNVMTGGLSLNLSIDSQEGVGFSPSASLGWANEEREHAFNTGASYSSRRGLGDVFLGMNTTAVTGVVHKTEAGHKVSKKGERGLGGTSSLGFANSSHTPTVSQEMRGENLSVKFKTGIDIWGTYGSAGLSGYFSTQYLKDAGVKTLKKGYGYLNMQNVGDAGMSDFNREKDGLVRKEMPNLSMPNLTYDIYSVAGQGTGGMYRPFRHDVGIIHDQATKSKVEGAAFGLEVGGGTSQHIGVNGSVNYSQTKSGKWSDENDVNGVYAFADAIGAENEFKPYSFKRYGEHTSKATNHLDYIGGEEPVAIKLNGEQAASTLIDASGNDLVTSLSGKKNERTPASMSVADYSNSEINSGLLPLFDVQYHSNINAAYGSGLSALPRSHGKHIGGFIATNPNGLRYVYGLPAYNLKQEEYQFSVNEAQADKNKGIVASSFASGSSYKVANTDQYFSKTSIPEYAHSYLLTSIVGPDYIDADAIPGPSEGDLGYWVKFNYGKASDNYQWRVPFEKATYSPGSGASATDDKGSFLYGEKELWYLKSAETKSHVAIFDLSARKDGKGSGKIYNDDGQVQNGSTASQYKIDKISLYTRDEYNANQKPIKEVHFEYTYDLCQGVLNYDANGDGVKDTGGKLTLKKVYFTYGHSTRGRLNPYEFDYNETDPLYNPDYDMYAVDRWGNYRPGTARENSRFPYVNQAASQANLDIQTSAWHLRNIQLPSGGDIAIDYESDDYAYVQERGAMQMFKIVGLDAGGASAFANTKEPADSERRVYFEFQNPQDYPSDGSVTASELKTQLENQYLGGQRKLYFNLHSYLRKISEPVFMDYVAGYADVEDWDISTSSNDGSHYTQGYIQLKKGKLKNGRKYHPLQLAAMQHLRINNPDLIQIGVSFDDSQSLSDAQKAAKVKSLVSMTATIRQVFGGYYNYAFGQKWGQNIIKSESFIRLKNPIGRKYGGGNRVTSIVLNDGWDDMTGTVETASEYGQVYAYAHEDGTSSGVAAYEPIIGGDEIPHRQPKEFPEATQLKTNNNLYFEEPYNEQFYPAPLVGYSRVEVKSLALHRRQQGSLPSGIGTTGSSVNEFYTAKDYPVISEATQLRKATGGKGTMNTSWFFLPIPLLGQITNHKLTASQGYAIKLNDMHGKPKKIVNYAHDADGQLAHEVSSVEYVYRDKEKVLNGISVRELDNEVPVIERDQYTANVTKTNKLVGVDYDFFTDMRETETISVDGGVAVNTEILLIGPIPVPAFVPWPNIGESTDRVRLAVTNKIIHKSGILEKIVANNEGSELVTDNIYYDDLTGKPVLTSVNNNFDDKVYTYNMPAHWQYEGMGSTYENIGMSFGLGNTSIIANNSGKIYISPSTIPGTLEDKLKPGDEFLVGSGSGYTMKLIYGGVDIDNNSSDLLFWSDDKTTPLPKGSRFLLTRSGARNMLEQNMTQLTTLSDPTTGRTVDNCDYEAEYFEESNILKRVLNSPCVDNIIESLNILLDVDPSGSYPSFKWKKHSTLGWVEWKANNVATVNPSVVMGASNGSGPYLGDGDASVNEVWLTESSTSTKQNFSLITEAFDCTSSWDCSPGQKSQQFGIRRLVGSDWNCYGRYSFNFTFSAGGYSEYAYYGMIIPNDRSKDCTPADCCNRLRFEHPSGEHCVSPFYNTLTLGDISTRDGDGYAIGHDGNYLIGTDGGYIYVSDSYYEISPIDPERIVSDENGFRLEYVAGAVDEYVVPLDDIDEIGLPYLDQYHVDWDNALNNTNVMYVDLKMKNGTVLKKVRFAFGGSNRINWKKTKPVPFLAGPNTGNIDFDFAKLDQVLNISAQSYSDNWNQDFYDVKPFTAALRDKTPYFNGEKGIWRAQNTYTYLANRNQSANPDLDADGDMDNVPIFDHSVANFEQCIPEWRKVNEITTYSATGNEVENRDILGRYSSATFSHNGQNVSALAQNTSYRELGYEGFESYNTGNIKHQIAQQSSNLQFHTTFSPTYLLKKVDISMARGNIIILDFPYDVNLSIDKVTLEGHYVDSREKGEFYGNYEVGDYDMHPNDPNKSIVYLADPPDIVDDGFWDGKLSIRTNVLVSPSEYTNQAVITTTKAHTGNKSIYVDGGPSINNHIQNDLQLEPGKRYVISAWVSQNDESVITYATGTTPANNNVGLVVNSIDPDGNFIGTGTLFTPTGPIIEGWQKIESSFVVKQGAAKTMISLKSVSGLRTYFDDIRVFPFDGNMESYAYNREDNRLSDILDNNNYSTHYNYDEQGNLFLIKKETEEGWKSIQESRTHIVE